MGVRSLASVIDDLRLVKIHDTTIVMVYKRRYDDGEDCQSDVPLLYIIYVED